MTISLAIAQWNLARLAETLLPLLADDKDDTAIGFAQDALGAFAARFEAAYGAGLGRKLGFFQSRPSDLALAQELLGLMADNGADFTLTFRRLAGRGGRSRCGWGYSAVSFPTLPASTLGWRKAHAASRGRRRSSLSAGLAMMRAEPCDYSAQSSRGGGNRRRRERWGFPALREFADGALHALRGSTGLRPLRRSAAARSSRAPNVLRHLTREMARTAAALKRRNNNWSLGKRGLVSLSTREAHHSTNRSRFSAKIITARTFCSCANSGMAYGKTQRRGEPLRLR